MDAQLWIPLIAALALIAGGAAGFLVTRRLVSVRVREADERAEELLETARREANTLRKAAEVEGREAIRADREAFDRELKESQESIRERERKLEQRERDLDRIRERLDGKSDDLDRRKEALQRTEAELERRTKELDEKFATVEEKLAAVAGLTAAEAREELLKRVEDTARLDAARLSRRIEQEAKDQAEEKAHHTIALAIQRYAGEYIAQRTVTVVPIPDDQMKGRIIGREGRNIRTFESITGVDLVVDDTPESVVISCHNPLRREIARRTLERLIEDGRIQPGRIEEIYQAVVNDTEKAIREAGQRPVFELGLQDLHPELVRLMGMNMFRTSYSQNVLLHSAEVGYICGMMADELKLDRMLARRVGFLHDIGKAVDHEFEGSHAEIGAELCKKFDEDEAVVRAVAEHHDDPPSTIYGVLVQAADTLSAARPGARRETLTNYVKRLEDLEQIATRHPEVQRAFAIQAGRELRVALDSERVGDDGAYQIAKAVAAEIESQLKYPGQIKVTVLRELRAVAYAK